MRPFIVLLSVVFILAFGIILLWKNQSGSAYLLSEYQKIAPFSSQEMTYHSVSKTLSGNGLIFHKPLFPNLPLRFKADRLQMRATPLEIQLHFSGVILDIAQTLLMRDGISLTDTLKNFTPPTDFAIHPLEGFVLLNRDIFKGTLDLNLKYEGRQTRALLTLLQKGKEVLRFTTIIHNIKPGLWRWTEGTFQWIQLTVSDAGLCQAIADYCRATGRPVPQDLQQSLYNRQPYQSTIRLTEPIPVSTLIKRF